MTNAEIKELFQLLQSEKLIAELEITNEHKIFNQEICNLIAKVI